MARAKAFRSIRRRLIFKIRTVAARRGEGTLPDFVILGAARCGTTALYRYLSEHPEVLPALRKEIHFFDTFYQEGLNWYQGFFPLLRHMNQGQRPKFLTGEATPYYLFHPQIPGRVHRDLPETKFIVLLRNPVDRALSHYQHKINGNVETETFEQALERERVGIDHETERIYDDELYQSKLHQHFSYVSRGVYYPQLLRWFNLFPRKQFLVLKSENLFQHTAETMGRVLRFLEVSDAAWTPSSFKRINHHGPYDQMRPETRQLLSEYYRPHNARLQQLLGDEFSWEHQAAGHRRAA